MSFYDMFELIITKISTVQNSLREVREEQVQINERIDQVSNTTDVVSQIVDDLDKEVEEMTDTNLKIMQATIKVEDTVHVIEKNVVRLTDKINKGCFIINGAEEVDAKEEIKNFFKNQLELQEEIEVQSAHKMGKAKYAPIWFKLSDPNDAAKIYKNISKLKDKENANKKKYKLREFTSDEMKELKIRQQDIVMENGRLPESHKVETTYRKGELYINEDKYCKEGLVPKVKDTLLMTRKHIKCD